jgi:two-component system chemotaxis response regulator CheB
MEAPLLFIAIGHNWMKRNTQPDIYEGKFSPIIVVGASAGGLEALKKLISQFDTKWKASVLVVLHLSQKSTGNYLIKAMQSCTAFTCKLAQQGEEIKENHIYFSPPNVHLLVKASTLVLGHGPKENRWRPSIDVLFRSAAVAFRSRVVGIILTGFLNDGTSGMLAIKNCGGFCIVQDPEEAEFPSMPRSVLDNVKVDYCVTISGIGAILGKIAKKNKPRNIKIPQETAVEAKLSEQVSTSLENIEKISVHSLFSCPDCGGGLWEMKENKLLRYRCHIGHVYSEKDLALKQSEETENTLWIALRIMEERRMLIVKTTERNKAMGLKRTIALYERNLKEIDVHIKRMKQLLFDIQKLDNFEG